MLSNIRVVLVATSHPGNIGAAARAMKTMGLSRLHLVQPEQFPSAEADARASGADDVLRQACVHETLEDAIADCRFVVGASARQRRMSSSIVEPRDCAARLLMESGAGEVAVVFGRESSGLTNEELARCHLLLHIPANPEYSSLNLAAAVQVVAYELRLAQRSETAAEATEMLEAASAADMARFYAHLEQVLVAIDFLDPRNPRHLMRRLRRLFSRARPDPTELNILRGILTAIEQARLRR